MITVPQIEYIGGTTPQESVALLNKRIMELHPYSPSFERDGMGFWVTYNKEVCEDASANGSKEVKRADGYPCCARCPLCERVSEKVKWGKCTRYGHASVSLNKKVCNAYWEI